MLVTEQHPGRVAVGGWCSRGEVSCPLGVVAVVVVCSRPGDKDEPGQRVTADPREALCGAVSVVGTLGQAVGGTWWLSWCPKTPAGNR